MKFSILFWNIWVYNQIRGKARADRLLNELRRLVEEHEPDFIALNEVAQSLDGTSAPVLECLRNLGYSYSHCASLARFDDYSLSGAALCSKLELSHVKDFIISKHGFAAKRGYPGYYKKAISARVVLPEGKDLNIIVAHPLAMIDALSDHRVAMNTLNKLMRSKSYSHNTILVGDMNEWRFIPGSFRRKVSDIMHSRTGSVLNPTWRYNAHRFTPLRLNLDHLYWSRQSDFSLKDFNVLSSNVSDHRPLLASFEQKVEGNILGLRQQPQ